ncbi:MAG TPA: CDP-alcohol phosphatidyltransferase family protein [Acidobacteriaceae bacterium]|nr:CDP-alcohol phosphatidyltransferase family protein [Acidobacteriaceae bacterium]
MLKELRAAPNLLTFLRLCLIPFLVLAVLDYHYRTALGLFIAAGLSDGLDGLAARVLKQQTQLGQYLDPVADKLLLSTLFLVLMHQRLVSLRVTVLVFSRDLGILIVASLLYMALGIRDFRPSIYGKTSTCAQILALVSVLLCQFYAPRALLIFRKATLQATVALTVVSALHYAWRTARRLSMTEPATP